MAKLKIGGKVVSTTGIPAGPDDVHQAVKKLTLEHAAQDGPVDKDALFRNTMNRALRLLEAQNPRRGPPQSVLTRVPKDISLEDAMAEGREARVAYVLDKVAINGGRGFEIVPKPDGRLLDREAELIATFTPHALQPHHIKSIPALYPSPQHEGLKYMLMLRDTDFSDQEIMELGLFLAPWYGLTRNSTQRLQGEILKQAKQAVEYNDIELVPLAQNFFTLDDMYGFGHALAVSRQIMERHNQDQLHLNEQFLFVHHLFQNYDLSGIEFLATSSDELSFNIDADLEREGVRMDEMIAKSNPPFAVQMVKLLPEMLRADLLYHDAVMHYLTGLDAEDFASEYTSQEPHDGIVKGTMQTLKEASRLPTSSRLKSFYISPRKCEEAVTKTLRAVKRFHQAIIAAKEIYEPENSSDKTFVHEATPILRAFGQFFLGIPYRDTFGPGGSRGPAGTPKEELMPTLFHKLYHL